MQYFQSLKKYLSLNYASFLSKVFLKKKKKKRLTSYEVHGLWLALTTENHFNLWRHYQRAKLGIPFPHDPQVQGGNLQKMKDSDLIKHVKKILPSRGWPCYRNISIYCIYLSRKSLDSRTLDLPEVRKLLPHSTAGKNSVVPALRGKPTNYGYILLPPFCNGELLITKGS